MRVRSFLRRHLDIVTSVAASCALSLCLSTGVAFRASAGPVLPTFSPANFTPGAPIDNAFFPLVPGTTFRYEGDVTDADTGDKSHERDEDFVTPTTKTIGGVSARVVPSRVWMDDVLAEDTFDYYAQDKSGNVWYLGEDTKAFEYDDNGKLINTDTTGSFRAGVGGAEPGFIMPADPQVGFSYFQENAPVQDALDQAQVVSRTEKITVPVGTFDNALKTLETTPLEPGLHENKYYAAGVGNILVEADIPDGGVAVNVLPLVSKTTVSAVPLPPAGYAALLTAVLAARATLNSRRHDAAR